MWDIKELKECTRYGILMVYIKDKPNGERICRRVRRSGDALTVTKEILIYKLPSEYADGSMLLTAGDLLFISQCMTVSVLRNERNQVFASITNGKLELTKDFFE